VGKHRDASREAFWRQALRRRVQCGMTIAEFCSSEGLTASAYHYWRREIERRDAESQEAEWDITNEPTLAAVELVEDAIGGATIEIVAETGYVIRVSEAATTEHVRRVLLAIRDVD
jgi:hypothetical protein